MGLCYVKIKKVGELAEGESEYDVNQIDEEELANYLANGYELAEESEYASQFSPTKTESAELDESFSGGSEEAGDLSLSDAGLPLDSGAK